jgi:hypothetical protein
MSLPTVMTSAGLQPQSPAALLAQLLALVAATNPDYTANLPASLIEDVSSTCVGALVIIDQARVETVNSLTPFGANDFVLNQLGQVSGVPLGLNSNTSVEVVFTGTPGFPIPVGFVVSDGTNQYAVQQAGSTGSGTSGSLLAIAVNPGTFAVPQNSVTTVVTSVPSNITLSVTNPSAGTPGVGAETEEDYRSRVLQAGLAAAQGMTRFLKTLLGNVPGVQSRLVRAISQPNGWEIIVGGSGDPNQIAFAIFQALFNINNLVGSTMLVTAATAANPMVITTSLNHGYSNGELVSMAGSTNAAYNFSNQAVTVIDNTHFSVPINSTGFGAYTAGGVLTPNLRNASGTVVDYPDVYSIPFVIPPQQLVLITATWNTTATNVNAQAIAQLAAPALAAYVNAIAAGLPMNQFVMVATFQDAVASILPESLLTRLVFTVTIAGVVTTPLAGTGEYVGDAESFFFTDPLGANITVNQG